MRNYFICAFFLTHKHKHKLELGELVLDADVVAVADDADACHRSNMIWIWPSFVCCTNNAKSFGSASK